jgi:F-type H+-transporting ATPase subunit delta
MQQSRVATRYASALFDQAQQDNTLETVIADMRGLKQMLAESRDLTLLFESPIMKASQKTAVVKALVEKAGISKTVHNFVLLLIAKSRESEIVQVIGALEERYNALKALAPVEVVSAFAMDADQQAKLMQQVEKTTGKKPVPTYTVNPALIGGFTVKVGDQVMDGSVKHQLDLLRKRLNAGAMSN